MKRYLLILLIPLLATAQTAPVTLPASFTTAKGTAIANGKVYGRTPTHLTIMHEGGMAKIPHEEMPAEVQTLLGLTPSAPAAPVVTLPDSLTIGPAVYTHPKLTGTDPDGIRITHDLGSAKIPFENLPPEITALVGPFDTDKAAAFRVSAREEIMQRGREARTVIQEQEATVEEAKKAVQASLHEAHNAALAADPTLLSPDVYTKIEARSDGGKNSRETWRTNYGSGTTVTTSSRTMTCTVTGARYGAQRFRLQCLWLSRNQATGKMDVDIIADGLVTTGPNATHTVVASAEAQVTDTRYVALRIRDISGGKYIAWSWRAIDGQGRICAVRSSSTAYDAYAYKLPVN